MLSPIWLAYWGGSKGVLKANFKKFDFPIVHIFQKGTFTVNMVMIWQKIGFGPNWPHMAIEGGAKRGLNIKFSKIWLHHCSKLSKRSLPCEYGDDWAKNRIWPQLAPPGHWRGGQMGSKSQILENLTSPLFKTSKKVPSLRIWQWSGKT